MLGTIEKLKIFSIMYYTKNTFMALRRMLVFEQVGKAFTPQNVAALRFAGNPDAPRRDKHTPCIKTNRLKRQNRSRAERAVRAKPLGESGPFFSHIGNAIFCPLFHRRIFSFFISTGEFCFYLFGVGIPARVYLNMRFPIQIHPQHSLF